MKKDLVVKKDNKLVMNEGCANFYRHAYAKTYWTDPDVPKFSPTWKVRFRVLGKSWEETSEIPVALGLEPVKVWAKERILTEAHLLMTGQLEKLREMRTVRREVMLSELIEKYLSNVPTETGVKKITALIHGPTKGVMEAEVRPKEDYRRNSRRLAAIFEEVTGLSAEKIAVSDELWSRETLLNWVRMRQEYFRRGWTKTVKVTDGKKTKTVSAAPADAWDTLRTELRARRLPGIDKTTVMEGNTTIESYLRCAKSVFANQREYLVGLDLPALKEFLEFVVNIAAPEGHREISEDIKSVIAAKEEAFKRDNPKAWAFGRVAEWTGGRPITLQQLGGNDLTVQPDGTGILGVAAAKGGHPILWPLPADLTSFLVEIRTTQSLWGVRNKTEARDVYLAFNAHLTACGVEGKHKTYLLRHARGQQLRDHGGVELSSEGLGHKTTTMVKRKYTKRKKAMPMLDPRAASKQTA